MYRHIMLFCCLLLAACGSTSSGAPDTPTQVANPATTATPEPAAPTQPVPTEAPPTANPTAAAGGIAPASLMSKIRADLMQRASVTDSEIQVVSEERKEWSDASLGCPQPDMMYPQVITDGYQIILEAQGKTYDYRAGRNDFFMLCVK